MRIGEVRSADTVDCGRECSGYQGGVVTIEAKQGPIRCTGMLRAAAVLAVAVGLLAATATLAAAGQASTGEPAFHPCTQCHPVTLGADGKPTKPLPVDLEKHEIELEVHDTLGKGSAGCLACHDEPTRNPGKLLLPDGSFVDITGDVSRVCQRCHFEKFREWQVGVHGKREPKCTAAGCHDPHTPSWIYVPALPPFQATGFQVKAVGEHEAFTPFAPPPVDPPVHTPGWFAAVEGAGSFVALGLLGLLVVGRIKR